MARRSLPPRPPLNGQQFNSSSELYVAEHFYAQSALADLSGIPTLRAAFPQMPRCELVDLRRHYWEVYREGPGPE